MKLQLLVPQHKETESDIKVLLDSISIQQNIDFDEIGVIICNDGSDVFLSEDWLSHYPYKIDYYKEPHRGVSGTRNACLDHATADYVMFCDADDMFYQVCSLFLVFMYIEAGFDAMYSQFLEETRERPAMKPIYITHDKDASFVHGKVYRRKYLLDNGLRFNEDLTVHEDSYFNYLALNLAEDAKYSDTPFYLWRWRDESICRNDPEYKFSTYKDLIDSNDALIAELVRRGRMDKAIHLVCYMVLETYYTMNTQDWQNNRKYREIAERRFAKYFTRWRSLWDAEPVSRKVEISDQARKKILKEGLLLEPITIFDWLKRIGENNVK